MTEKELYKIIMTKNNYRVHLNCMDCPLCGPRCYGAPEHCERAIKEFKENFERTHFRFCFYGEE